MKITPKQIEILKDLHKQLKETKCLTPMGELVRVAHLYTLSQDLQTLTKYKAAKDIKRTKEFLVKIGEELNNEN